MPFDDDDDLFGQDFDFVDEDEEIAAEDDAGKSKGPSKSAQADDSEETEKPRRRTRRGGKRGPKPREEAAEAKSDSTAQADDDSEQKADSEKADTEKKPDSEKKVEEEPAKPQGPPTDHVVHVYEYRKLKRTINRAFTSDDATAFAAEYNRTSAAHGLAAVAGDREQTPSETL